MLGYEGKQGAKMNHNDPELNPLGLIDRAALNHLKSKTQLAGFSHYDVWLSQHRYAFTVAKMMDKDMLQTVQAALQDAIAHGTDFDDFKRRLKPYLMSQGWWGEQEMIDPLDGLPKMVQLGSTRRLETIFATNLATAHAAGQWSRIQANKRALPYLQYHPSSANHQRDAHKRYYHLVLPVDHPIWQSIFPPNGYGCQCRVSQLTRSQAERIGISPEPKIEWEDVANPRTGEIVRVPADITPSFAHNHAQRTEAVLQLAADKHGQAFAEQLSLATHDYIAQRVVRPNFDNLIQAPQLTAQSSQLTLTEAQQLVDAHAGTGSQLGLIPAGKVGSSEWIKKGNDYFTFEYKSTGVEVAEITQTYLASIKQAQIKQLLQHYATPREWEKIQARWQSLQALDYGDADMADKLAAVLYTLNGGYDLINPELIKAKGQLAKIGQYKVIQFIRLLDDFLAHAPTYQGTTTRTLLAHNLNHRDAFLHAHQPDQLIRYSNFTSTCKPGGRFGPSQPDVLLTIHGKSGVDISALSDKVREKEVLMPRHAVYRVLAQNTQDKTINVELEEVSAKAYNDQQIVQLSALKG